MGNLAEILAKVERVDWSALQHAYGEASDVPGLLRGLVSGDEDTRQGALYQLCATIWHQGTVYEASPHAVPTLIEMLRSPEVPDKAGIALLLALMADGTASLELFADEVYELSSDFKAYLEAEGRDFDDELLQGRSYVQATREAVGLGLELLLPYLAHEEATVREGVAQALSRYPERAEALLPHLEAARASETEDYVCEMLDSAIDALKPHLPADKNP